MHHRGLRASCALIAAAASLAAAGCGSDDDKDSGTAAASASASGSGSKGKTVALFLPESKTARYESKDRPDFTAELKKLCAGCKLLYYNANQDAAKQQQQVEAAITQGAGVLALDPVDAASAAALATRAKQSKIPVISYSRLITGAPVDYFVSNDNEQVGVLQAQALMDGAKAKGIAKPRIVMINGSPQDSAAGDFKRGAHKILDAGADIVAEYDTPDWSPDKAQTEMEQAISKVGKGGFDAVYAANDGTAGGAIAAMKSGGVDPSTRFVTGQDAELAGIQRVITGDQFMTVYKKITPQAQAAAQLAAALAKGEDVPQGLVNAKADNGAGTVPSVYTPMVTVTADNVQKEIVDDGWWSAAEICTSAFKAACSKAGVS